MEIEKGGFRGLLTRWSCLPRAIRVEPVLSLRGRQRLHVTLAGIQLGLSADTLCSVRQLAIALFVKPMLKPNLEANLAPPTNVSNHLSSHRKEVALTFPRELLT